METELIKSHVEGHIGWIVLNNTRRKNALNNEMYRAIVSILQQYANDEKVRSIVVRGSGGNFSAGFDLSQGLPDPYRYFVQHISGPACWGLWYHTKPTISMVEGFCVGGGFELAMGSDLVYAAENATLGEPEIDFYFTPDFNTIPCHVSPRKAKEMIMLGSVVSGKVAVDLGLINGSFPPDQLEAEVKKVCDRIASLPAVTVEVAKRGLNAALDAQGFKQAVNYGEEIAIYNGLLCKTNEEVQPFYQTAKEKGIKEAMKLLRKKSIA